MKLILTTNIQGTFLRREIASATEADLASNGKLRAKLVTHASNQFGKEGLDWRIAQNPHGYLIPVYALCIRHIDDTSGDTITVE